MSEQWRPVVGYEGLYEVSDLGRIKSVRRPYAAGGLLAPNLNSRGRYRVSLRRDGCQKAANVHRLVAETFLGARPEGQVIRHLDGDLLNNVVSNLQYGTQSENNWDQVRHGTHANKRKTHCPKGHSYDHPDNLIVYRDMRYCRACQQQRDAGRSR